MRRTGDLAAIREEVQQSRSEQRNLRDKVESTMRRNGKGMYAFFFILTVVMTAVLIVFSIAFGMIVTHWYDRSASFTLYAMLSIPIASLRRSSSDHSTDAARC